MRGAIPKGFEVVICAFPWVGIYGILVVMTELPFATGFMARSLVWARLALTKATSVGDFAFLAVIARPFSIALLMTIRWNDLARAR